MTSTNDRFRDLDVLLAALCDETALPEQVAKLELLADDAKGLSYVLDYLQLDGLLRWENGRCNVEPRQNDHPFNADGDFLIPMHQTSASASCSLPPADQPPFVLPPIRCDSLPPAASFHTTLGYHASDWPMAYLVATMILLIGIGIGAVMHVSSPEQVAQPFRSRPSPLFPHSTSSLFVGRITRMVDCQWADPHTQAFSGASVPLGRRYALTSGLMEISYSTGAKVILQGPSNYEVDSPAGGFLSVGKLTAQVESKDEGRTRNDERPDSRSSFLIPHPYFAVRTPTATVTDLGTEFGVEVSAEGHTTSHVFRGSVEVRAAAANGEAEPSVCRLFENETACVTAGDGGRVTMVSPTDKHPEFVRRLPQRARKTLDLVGVAAGGDGFGKLPGRRIDSTTGDSVANDVKEDLVLSNGRYCRVRGLPYIDGVFVPCGKGAVQLDSVGHTFAEFPDSDGKSWGSIWAGEALPAIEGKPALPARLQRGLDYSAPWHSVLGMHANKGITFDLEAIRRARPQWKITQFLAVAGNSSLPEYDPGRADVWVFVDGQPRFRRERITVDGGELKVAVALDDQDRFLTLVSTDGGDGITGDLVIFGDPVLVLEPGSAKTVRDKQPSKGDEPHGK